MDWQLYLNGYLAETKHGFFFVYEHSTIGTLSLKAAAQFMEMETECLFHYTGSAR